MIHIHHIPQHRGVLVPGATLRELILDVATHARRIERSQRQRKKAKKAKLHTPKPLRPPVNVTPIQVSPTEFEIWLEGKPNHQQKLERIREKLEERAS